MLTASWKKVAFPLSICNLNRVSIGLQFVAANRRMQHTRYQAFYVRSALRMYLAFGVLGEGFIVVVAEVS
jgi:hypothetical protein